MVYATRKVDHPDMMSRTQSPPVDWVRRLSGFGIVLLVAASFYGFIGGVLSQVVFFSQYESLVEAQRYRPLILPCLVALVAAVAAGIAWRAAFVKERTPRSGVVPWVSVSLGALVVAGVLMGPSERALEARWTKKLGRLELPAEFRPVPVDPALRSAGRYEVVRHWATEQQPEQICGAVQRALESWLASGSVNRAGDRGCYLSAVDGNDSVSTSFLGGQSRHRAPDSAGADLPRRLNGGR